MRLSAAQSFDPALCFVVSLRMDVVDLRNFYAHPLGTVARRFVGRGVRRLWAGSAGLRVLGVGYATPYLGLFREEAERCLAFMPAAQGVVKWPTDRPGLAALIDDLEMPLTDSAVDRIFLVHALEMVHDPIALLREVWPALPGRAERSGYGYSPRDGVSSPPRFPPCTSWRGPRWRRRRR